MADTNNTSTRKRRRRRAEENEAEAVDATQLTKADSAEAETQPEDEGERPHLRGPKTVGLDTFFDPDDLAHYELAQAKVANADLLAQLIESELKRVKIEHERRLEVLGGRLRLARQTKKQLANDLLRLQTRIGDKYSLDLSAIAYDDRTGKINTLPN